MGRFLIACVTTMSNCHTKLLPQVTNLSRLTLPDATGPISWTWESQKKRLVYCFRFLRFRKLTIAPIAPATKAKPRRSPSRFSIARAGSKTTAHTSSCPFVFAALPDLFENLVHGESRLPLAPISRKVACYGAKVAEKSRSNQAP